MSPKKTHTTPSPIPSPVPLSLFYHSHCFSRLPPLFFAPSLAFTVRHAASAAVQRALLPSELITAHAVPYQPDDVPGQNCLQPFASVSCCAAACRLRVTPRAGWHQVFSDASDEFGACLTLFCTLQAVFAIAIPPYCCGRCCAVLRHPRSVGCIAATATLASAPSPICALFTTEPFPCTT